MMGSSWMVQVGRGWVQVECNRGGFVVQVEQREGDETGSKKGGSPDIPA